MTVWSDSNGRNVTHTVYHSSSTRGLQIKTGEHMCMQQNLIKLLELPLTPPVCFAENYRKLMISKQFQVLMLAVYENKFVFKAYTTVGNRVYTTWGSALINTTYQRSINVT